MARKKHHPGKSKISKTSNFGSDGIDRFSNLHEPLIHHIFSFLQTIEVVKSSSWSRRWRYVWTSFPYLNFDRRLIALEHPALYYYQGNFDEIFADLVNYVLNNPEECDIRRFRISCLNRCNGWMDRWIRDVVRRNVQELDISFCPDDLLELPHCYQMAKSLTVLKLNLYYHVLKMPTSIAFSRLTFLHLVSLKFIDDYLARQLFVSCPLLENLTLERCVFKNLNVFDITAINLKHLTIENGYLGGSIGDDGLCESKLKIFAPNLLSFKYIGPVAQDYILQNLSSIADVVVQLVHGFAEVALEELGYLICKLIRGFHCTKVLGLSASLLEYLLPLVGQIECFHAPFCNLKSLRLYSGLNKFHFPVIVLLLKYSPNLEALDIEFCETSDSSYNWQPEDGAVECLAHCLKKVQIKGFQGWKIELEFVSFLLEHGRVLEELTITWLMDEDLQNVAMLSRLPRASSNLALKFLNE